jgi:HJR/Mrr/RecB family endonuclease
MKLLDRIKFKKLITNLTINQIDALKGVEFEKFLCDFFDYLGYKSSTTTATGDNGIDILARIGHNSIGIQAKLYYNHNVGNKAIQEVFAGKSFYNVKYSIVCTNSYFSQPAKILAIQLKVGLMDRDTLISMLNNSRKENKILIKQILTEIN